MGEISNLLPLAQGGEDLDSVGAGAGAIVMLIYIGLAVLVIAGMWKAFAKAGQPGWAVLVPIYNIYVLLQVAGRPGWWLLLCIIPIVNLVISLIVCLDVAKRFGKDGVFGIGLWLLGVIFWPILGFGSAEYRHTA